jgi:membrane protein DedA with SNARE-associated domain
MLAFAAIISVSSSLGYLLPAIIGLESMGIPSPGETALILASVLASQGKLNIWLVIVIGAASAIAGDNAGYTLGRHLGRDVLIAAGPFRARRRQLIELGDRYFARHGPRTIFIGRWVFLIRFAVAWLAGINDVPFRVFFTWNALGAITWATTYGLLGYFGGTAVIDVFKAAGLIAGIGVAIVLAILAVLAKLRERRAEREQLSGDEGAADRASGKP